MFRKFGNLDLFRISDLFSKIVFPDLLDPIDQLSEFIKKGHLVEIVFE